MCPVPQCPCLLRRRRLGAAALLLVTITLAACTSGDAAPVTLPVQAPQVTRLVVVPANAAVPRGGLLPFAAEAYDQNNVRIPTPAGLTWSVDSSAIAAFDASGPQALLRATSEFRTTVRVKLGTVQGTASLVVTP